jgi:hypothetical protein
MDGRVHFGGELSVGDFSINHPGSDRCISDSLHLDVVDF